jgi:zinc transport system substrate-binding protein
MNKSLLLCRGEKMRGRNVWLLSLIVLLMAGVTAADKVKVAASIYPLYDWVQQLGGERVEARCIVPPGSSPHFYAPTPAEVRWLSEAKLFFLIGRGMEEWAEKLVRSLGEKEIKRVRLSEGLLALDSKGRELTDERGADPHVWLAPQLAMEMCRRITDELIKVDPSGKNLYEENLARYLKQLKKLDGEIKATITQLQDRDYV